MTEQFEVLPPPPPTPNPMNFVPGIFDYIRPKHSNYKELLIIAYEAITCTNTWNFIQKDCESFMSSREPEIIMIRNKMEEQNIITFNDSRFGCIMRDMQYIAIYGEEQFMEKYLRNSKE